MMLSGQISIELTVDDYVAAADHQKRIEGLLARIRDTYPNATLTLRERRRPKPPLPRGDRGGRPALYGEA
ncbi:hypothetical protein [Phenylobacterium sp.]|jgi:hypothetical protein|uniref:hypothetical protein n=1 Tax=Phenylobacterium sp. TaxID=1871053 RepID=UPI0012220B0E|nr:hypothetical protein [Phenylobacterium sp.]THD62432.1 MAG: hypothetical protein E8A12_09375 [Phenylobacterium sp.]